MADPRNGRRALAAARRLQGAAGVSWSLARWIIWEAEEKVAAVPSLSGQVDEVIDVALTCAIDQAKGAAVLVDVLFGEAVDAAIRAANGARRFGLVKAPAPAGSRG